MNTLQRYSSRAVILATLFVMGGCTNLSEKDADTVYGAGAGAVAGAVVTGGSPVGTAAGAAVGGLIGRVIGDEMDDEKD
jgi:osmotically inducible lipoprotein OsmB